MQKKLLFYYFKDIQILHSEFDDKQIMKIIFKKLLDDAYTQFVRA